MAFEARQVEKTYMAWVEGLLPLREDWQTIDLPIQADWERRPLRIIAPAGQASQTRWRCIAHHAEGTGSLLELQPLTGRTHQLRVHLQAIGHPIWGDALYAPDRHASTQPPPHAARPYTCLHPPPTFNRGQIPITR
jgi:tRNA pseudouridine32 synthase / 23S rRNA pseudouridine746 synthase